MNKNTLFIVITAILILIATVLYLGFFWDKLPFLTDQALEEIPLPVQPSATTTINGTDLKVKIYRNTEFGFEFEYPEDWSFEITSFYSPFSKFNLQGNTSDKNYNPFNPAFIINIVTPDFVERQFSDFKNIASETIVGEVTGFKYVYEEQGTQITIVLPFGRYKMILGTTKAHENIFNQILASFKFFKSGTPVGEIDDFKTGRIVDIYPQGERWFIKVHAVQYIRDPGAMDGYRTVDLQKEKVFPIITDAPMTLTSDAAYQLVETGFMGGDSERPWTIKPVSITKLIPSMEEKGVSWREAIFMRQLYHFSFENSEVSALVQQYVP